MSKLIRLTLVTVVLIASLPAIPALAQGTPPTLPPGCQLGVATSGAQWLICVPPKWNHNLVMYAHGYVKPGPVLAIPWEQMALPGGPSIPELVTSLGFAFATTSYSTNGLAVQQGIDDLRDLVTLFVSITHTPPNRTFLVGASEGGLITTLAVERYPQTFSGGLATCGPVGDFRKQVNYWGDLRVVFDYYFPGLIPGSAISVPQSLMDSWENSYYPQVVLPAIANPASAYSVTQLLRVTQAAYVPSQPDTAIATISGILWYNVFATNDGIEKLKGQPFDNNPRWYFGSNNDWLLNKKVQRFDADPAALFNIANYYQTSGRLKSPLVTLHTTGDPIVPYWHEPLYRLKVWGSGSALMYSNIPILRYGHCNFKASEVLAGFALLVLKVTGKELVGGTQALPDAAAQSEFLRLAKEHGALR